MANNNKHTGPNVPALRFPEFSEEWEKFRVSDFIEFFSTNSLSWDQLEYRGAGLLNLHYGMIHNGLPIQVDASKNALPSIKEDYYPKKYTLCKEGDIAFADASEDTNDVGKAIEFNNCAGKSIVCGLHTIHGRDRLGLTYTGFKGYLFSSKVYHDQIKSIAQGTKVFSIKASNFDEVILGLPKIEEQKKISSLLMAIDDRILTQSKIIEELKTLRGALVDTYINDGNNNNENQTIMSLGAYGCFVRGLTYSSVDVADNTATTGVVRSNNLEYGSPVDIKSGLVYVTKKPSPEQMLVNGDIVICMANGSSSLVGKASNYQELCRNMTVGAFCGIYRGTHPLTKWIFMSSAYCKAVANAIQGGNGAIANLHAEDILSMCFAVPSDYKTITELGKLMSLFDEKLHAAEEQLARFIEQKKYFLFKMFI